MELAHTGAAWWVLGLHPTPAFLPVRVIGEPMLAPPAVTDPARASANQHDPDCRIEVTLPNGAIMRVGQDVSLARVGASSGGPGVPGGRHPFGGHPSASIGRAA